jgi:hypothetical protein
MMTYDDESDKSSERLPRERLLKALTGVYDLIAAVLPPAGRRLITRCAHLPASVVLLWLRCAHHVALTPPSPRAQSA